MYMYVTLYVFIYIYRSFTKIFYTCIYILVLDTIIYIHFDFICIGTYKRSYFHSWG